MNYAAPDYIKKLADRFEEAEYLRSRDAARAQVREGLDALIELQDFKHIKNLLIFTEERLPK